jgi:hypothetical protein
MRLSLSNLILLTFFWGCSRISSPGAPDYPRQVGDLSFDAKTDDPNFRICNEAGVFQYYNFGHGVQYKGEKPKIVEHFTRGLTKRGDSTDTGFLTIRFVVNCQGATGRFRVQGIDNDYQEKKFSPDLTEQLLSLTKELDGWIVGEYEGKIFDYYQYLTFKMEKGDLLEIMP